MGVFNNKQKNLARSMQVSELESAVQQSKSDLHMAVDSGDKKLLQQAIKTHTDYERALFYKNTYPQDRGRNSL